MIALEMKMKIRKYPLVVLNVPSPGLIVSAFFSHSKALAIRLASIFFALTFLSGANAVYAAPIIVGASGDTGSLLLGNFMQGYDFVPTTDLTLTALGFWDSFDGFGDPNGFNNNRSFQVGLWETATATPLANAIISSTSEPDLSNPVLFGAWRYESVAPVSLASGTSYTLAFQVGAQLGDSETLLISEGLLTYLLTDVVPGSTRFLNSNGVFTFPTLTGSAGGLRGNVNAQVTAVPIPAAAWLFTSALGLLGWMRCKAT